MRRLATCLLAMFILLVTARLGLGGAAIVRTVTFDFSYTAIAPSIATFPVPLQNNSGTATFVLTSDGSGSGINSTLTSLDNVVGSFFNLFDTSTTLPIAPIPATYLDFQGGAESSSSPGTFFSHAGWVPPANTPGSITLPHPHAGGGAPASTGTLNLSTGVLSLFPESRTDISPLLALPPGTAIIGSQPLTLMDFVLTGAPGGGNSGMDGTYEFAAGAVPHPELIDLWPGTQGIAFPDNSLQILTVFDSTGAISGPGDVSSYGTEGTVAISGSDFNVNNLLNWVPGDANLDGIVNILDVGVVSDNWMASGTFGVSLFTEDGDVNMDGVVNILDVGTISDNWMDTAMPFQEAIAAFSLVPEPSSVVMLAVGGVLVALGGWRFRRATGRNEKPQSTHRTKLLD